MEKRKLTKYGDYGFKYPRKKFRDNGGGPWYNVDAIIFSDSNRRTCRVGWKVDSGYYFSKIDRIYKNKKEFEAAVREWYYEINPNKKPKNYLGAVGKNKKSNEVKIKSPYGVLKLEHSLQDSRIYFKVIDDFDDVYKEGSFAVETYIDDSFGIYEETIPRFFYRSNLEKELYKGLKKLGMRK